MSKYRSVTNWNEFENMILSKVEDVSKPKVTDFINYLLLKGGPIKDLHEKINSEQKARNSKGYSTTGYLFNDKGEIQQRTLFGHIAYLIIDEKCTILIDDISIDKNTKKSTLDNCYDNNSFIRIERIKTYNRPEKYNISTSNDIGINNSEQIEVFPDEIREDQKYYEGSTTRISVNRFERSNKARNICISNHKAVCNVCGFNFEKKYGQIGKGFIHVHHLVELSTINKKYHVDPEKDLIPVCPNCHAMLHAKTPPYTITELQHIIAQAG